MKKFSFYKNGRFIYSTYNQETNDIRLTKQIKKMQVGEQITYTDKHNSEWEIERIL
jgi:hypothetical protein